MKGASSFYTKADILIVALVSKRLTAMQVVTWSFLTCNNLNLYPLPFTFHLKNW